MDARTRKKLLGKASLLMHLIQEHHGAIPAGADYADVYREGLDAINALALPVVVRQQVRRANRAADAVRVALEVYAGTVDTVNDEPVSVPSCWPVEAPVAGEQWGIGRGLPTGDVQ